MFDREFTSVPDGLDDMEPSVELATALNDIDVDLVSPHDRIIVIRAYARMESYYQARKYRAMASVADALEEDDMQHGLDTAAAEIQAALCLTRRATETELGFALDLWHRLPQVWSALAAGMIDYRRARVISLGTVHLDTGAAWEVVERILEDAGRLTSGELRSRLHRMAIEADPEDARLRYEDAVKERRVVLEPADDGTANLLGLQLAPHRAAAASRHVNHLARSLRTRDETRTMDQLRADVLIDLLLGKAHSGKKAGAVNLRVDLETLSGLAEDAGELNGYGPVIADIARQIAAEAEDAEWRYAITDPHTGQLITDGTTRRRPTAALRRTVEARDQTCVFPGCRVPAVDCDFDHSTRWADGGETTEDNGAPLCRHNHITKDQLGWSYRRLRDGRYRWRSRLGHTYYSARSP